jgi:hypothetical protein
MSAEKFGLTLFGDDGDVGITVHDPSTQKGRSQFRKG